MRPPRARTSIERGGGFRAQHRLFVMHLVVGGVIHFHRQKCAGADMQRHMVQRDAGGLQGGEKRPA